MPASTITSKGQVTIPRSIREQLRLRRGQRLDFQLADDGQLILKPRARDIRELKGILRTGRRRAATVAEMNEAIAEGFSKSAAAAQGTCPTT